MWTGTERAAVGKAADKAAQTAGEQIAVIDKSKQKKLLFAAVGAVLLLFAMAITCVTVFGDSDRKLQEQLDLGAKYLEEMDYEQALVAFYAALEIEPMNADAYLGIVEVYIRTNEFETALEYAKEGYEVTGDERLKEKIDMIESGDIFASNGWTMRASFYDGDGNLLRWHEYTYNLQGWRESIVCYSAQGVQEQYLEYVYDAEGKNIVSCDYYVTGEIAKRVLEYDTNFVYCTVYEGTSDIVNYKEELEINSDGYTLKETRYGADGHFIWMRVYEYGDGNKVTKVAYYNESGEQTQYQVEDYDENGRHFQTLFYDENDVLTSYFEDVYDAEGKCIGNRYYDGNGVLQYEQISK